MQLAVQHDTTVVVSGRNVGAVVASHYYRTRLTLSPPIQAQKPTVIVPEAAALRVLLGITFGWDRDIAPSSPPAQTPCSTFRRLFANNVARIFCLPLRTASPLPSALADLLRTALGPCGECLHQAEAVATLELWLSTSREGKLPPRSETNESLTSARAADPSLSSLVRRLHLPGPILVARRTGATTTNPFQPGSCMVVVVLQLTLACLSCWRELNTSQHQQQQQEKQQRHTLRVFGIFEPTPSTTTTITTTSSPQLPPASPAAPTPILASPGTALQRAVYARSAQSPQLSFPLARSPHPEARAEEEVYRKHPARPARASA